MKNRAIFVAVLVLIALISAANTAWCSWITFTNYRIEQLDVSQYRFRTNVAWNIDPVLIGYDYPSNWWEHQLDPSIPLLPGRPLYVEGMLNKLRINLEIAPLASLYSAYNPTINHLMAPDDPGWSLPGDWYGGGWVPSWSPASLIGPEFGWDFTYIGDLDACFNFSWSADFVYAGHYFLPDGTGSYYDYFPHIVDTHEGSFTLGVIPEPATLLLIGIGLCGIGTVKRRKY